MHSLRHLPRAARAIATGPHLAIWMALPATVNASLLALALGYSWGRLASVQPPEGWLGTIGAYAWPIALALALFLAIYLASGLVASPFWDRLTERYEEDLSGHPFDRRGGLWLGDLARSALHTALSFALWLTFQLVLLPLQLLPVVGGLVEITLGFGGTALFAARELLDPALTRRRVRYLDKWRTVWAHKRELFWLGAATVLLCWVPLFNFVFLPVALAAGTSWWVEAERRGIRPGAVRAGGHDLPAAAGAGRYP